MFFVIFKKPPREAPQEMLEELRENRFSTGGDLRKIWGNNRDQRILYIGIVRDARAEKKKLREKPRSVLCCWWKFQRWGNQEVACPVPGGGDPENKGKYKEGKDEYEDEIEFEDAWTNHRNPRTLHKICGRGAQQRKDKSGETFLIW